MAQPGFHLEGNAARQYEQGIVPTMSQPLAEMLFEHVVLHDGDRVVDVACGTGILARVATARFANIASMTGVDLNPAMLDIARANAPSTRTAIAWQQGDACHLPFPDHSFDVVLCQHGLQFMPDQEGALHEMRRVLVPGGRVALIVWGDPPPYQAALAEALRRHVSQAAATSCLAPFALRDVDALSRLVVDAEFHDIAIQTLVLMRRLPWSVVAFAAQQPYGRDVEAVSEAARAAIEHEVQATVQAYRADNECVILPQESHLVHARRG
ncbi:MAG: class I SAM-dependent methyltransferase [Candidatus Tectimicrobiota bacterium]